MKKKLFFIFTILLLVVASPVKALNIYLFYGDGCPHCAKEKEYLNELKESYDIDLKLYEVWYDEDNIDLLNRVQEALDAESNYVPYTVIGDSHFIGFNDNTKTQIKKAIEECMEKECDDIVNKVINNEEIIKDNDITEKQIEETTEEDNIKTIPLLGDVNIKEFSLPIISIVMGLVDGFNPCAMWILIFLISMLLGTKDRKRMWILGLTFILTSAIIYFLIMIAWLNIALKMNQIICIRNIIAIIALIGAFINLKSFYKSIKKDVGCEVVDNKKRKNIIDRIKKFTTKQSLILAMLGIMLLAVSVNIIEFACSAGLPLLFTQILSLNDLSSLEYFLYIIIYIIFFLFDDIIIFTIAMISLKVTGISNKYNKYSHLIGGIIMFIIGLLLLLKPEWIMFNF